MQKYIKIKLIFLDTCFRKVIIMNYKERSIEAKSINILSNNLNIQKNKIITINQIEAKLLQSFFSSKRVTINVGGIKHEVLWQTLEKFPLSRLGKIRSSKSLQEIQKLCDDINIKENELFFDRPSKSFNSIIDYYRTNKLHVIDDICIISFYEDLNYWIIDDSFFEPCCNLKYHEKKEDVLEIINKVYQIENEKVQEDEFTNCCPTLRKKIWDIMENPQTSSLAKVIKIFIYL